MLSPFLKLRLPNLSTASNTHKYTPRFPSLLPPLAMAKARRPKRSPKRESGNSSLRCSDGEGKRLQRNARVERAAAAGETYPANGLFFLLPPPSPKLLPRPELATRSLSPGHPRLHPIIKGGGDHAQARSQFAQGYSGTVVLVWPLFNSLLASTEPQLPECSVLPSRSSAFLSTKLHVPECLSGFLSLCHARPGTTKGAVLSPARVFLRDKPRCSHSLRKRRSGKSRKLRLPACFASLYYPAALAADSTSGALLSLKRSFGKFRISEPELGSPPATGGMEAASHCSLRVQRLLLDPKFEGYKLSLEPLACYQVPLESRECRLGGGRALSG